MEESRTKNVKRNIFYGYLSTIITAAFSIISRTIFVYTLGAGYLGVSGLFSNVLGVLSFTELGIGSAIVFSLYKPIAEDDREKIKSLLGLYKNAYRIIAVVVTGIGVAIVPFLGYIVNSEIPMAEIRIYYSIFLFNTVSSYFVTYKTAYVTAIQKDYIVTNTSTIGTIVATLLQIILLLLKGSYLGYLVVACVIGLLQKVFTVIYLNKKYPILIENQVQSLDSETKNSIWRNVSALIIHKIGDVAVNQTDNIIVSTFVNTAAVGVLSNYTTINALVASFTNRFFSSFTASFGNMIAKEGLEKQRKIFDVYDLLGFWVYGFVMIAFITLVQPLIVLWLGEGLLMDNLTVILYFISLYLTGITYVSYNFKVAAGKFNEDKWVAFVQAVVNLVVSIIAIKMIGMPGVFVGTIVSRMVVVFVRPYIVYKYVLEQSVVAYYTRLCLRSALAFSLCLVMWRIKALIMPEVTVMRFILLCGLTTVIPNVVFFFLFRKCEAFKDILSRVRKRG